jgi:DNA-binding GntR family transcriptional regulator
MTCSDATAIFWQLAMSHPQPDEHKGPIERPKSLTAIVLGRLRDAIVCGDFKLGEPLSEQQLAGRYGVSKTPIREALAQLKLEGLVRIVPHSKTFVFTLSAAEIVELCDFRLALEATALRFAMERDHFGLAEALSQVVEHMEVARKRGDVRSYLKEDTQFHEQIFAHCGNRYLWNSYAVFAGKIAALRTHLAAKPAHTDLSYQEHCEMTASAARNDLKKALQVLDRHIARTKNTYPFEVLDIAEADRQLTANQKKALATGY